MHRQCRKSQHTQDRDACNYHSGRTASDACRRNSRSASDRSNTRGDKPEAVTAVAAPAPQPAGFQKTNSGNSRAGCDNC